MIQQLKKIFGIGPGTDYKKLLEEGAQIIDVRSRGEFEGGHISGSVNIPLDSLKHNLKKINRNKPVIVCCASGMRSASAKSMLASNGFAQVFNGGGWMSLERKLGK